MLLNQRSDGRMEMSCIHGIGHTIKVPEKHKSKSAWWSHGCDGCCKEWKIEQLEKKLDEAFKNDKSHVKEMSKNE